MSTCTKPALVEVLSPVELVVSSPALSELAPSVPELSPLAEPLVSPEASVESLVPQANASETLARSKADLRAFIPTRYPA
jgi:hypothetical protein